MRQIISQLRRLYPAMMIRDLEIFLSVVTLAGPSGTCKSMDVAKDTGINATGISRSTTALCDHKILTKQRNPQNGRELSLAVHKLAQPVAKDIADGFGGYISDL